MTLIIGVALGKGLLVHVCWVGGCYAPEAVVGMRKVC
jgi:hypothetical protein